jgi:hypothetical protein
MHTSVCLSSQNGIENWSCPQCGRTVVIQWPLDGKDFTAAVLVPADPDSTHRRD